MNTIIWSTFLMPSYALKTPVIASLACKQASSSMPPLSLKGFEWIYPIFHHKYTNKHQTNAIKTHMIA
jgi:hypothetical protein